MQTIIGSIFFTIFYDCEGRKSQLSNGERGIEVQGNNATGNFMNISRQYVEILPLIMGAS
jgi:hypothetical protein